MLLLQSGGLSKQRMKEGKEITNKLERKCPECSMSNKYNTVTERNTMYNVKQVKHGDREKYNVTQIQLTKRQIQCAMSHKYNKVTKIQMQCPMSNKYKTVTERNTI